MMHEGLLDVLTQSRLNPYVSRNLPTVPHIGTSFSFVSIFFPFIGKELVLVHWEENKIREKNEDV